MSAVRAIQIRAQMGAIKLEKLGMKRRGQSLAAMLKNQYGLPKSASYDQVLEKLQADFERERVVSKDEREDTE